MDLMEVEFELKKVANEIKEKEAEMYKAIKNLKNKEANLIKTKKLLMNGVNVDRVENARKFITIDGCKYYGGGETKTCVDDCIDDISQQKFKILNEYFGCKDYAGFHLQREDHRYGYGPKYGAIIFSIKATCEWREDKVKPSRKDLNDILYALNILKSGLF